MGLLGEGGSGGFGVGWGRGSVLVLQLDVQSISNQIVEDSIPDYYVATGLSSLLIPLAFL